jgi:hypothetical protein
VPAEATAINVRVDHRFHLVQFDGLGRHGHLCFRFFTKI